MNNEFKQTVHFTCFKKKKKFVLVLVMHAILMMNVWNACINHNVFQKVCIVLHFLATVCCYIDLGISSLGFTAVTYWWLMDLEFHLMRIYFPLKKL